VACPVSAHTNLLHIESNIKHHKNNIAKPPRPKLISPIGAKKKMPAKKGRKKQNKQNKKQTKTKPKTKSKNNQTNHKVSIIGRVCVARIPFSLFVWYIRVIRWIRLLGTTAWIVLSRPFVRGKAQTSFAMAKSAGLVSTDCLFLTCYVQKSVYTLKVYKILRN
jgi:hypothetical protein